MNYDASLGRWDAGQWTMVPHAFFRFCGGIEAFVLAAVVQIAVRREKDGKVHNGFFRCTQKDLGHFTSNTLKESNQRSAVDRLCRMGILSKKRRGTPGVRWLKVDVDRLGKHNSDRNSVAEQSAASLTTSPQLSCGATYIKHAYKHALEGKKVRSIRKRKQPDPQREMWTRIGAQLHVAASTVRTVSITSTPYKWGEAIKRLHTTDKVPFTRIQEIMDWYCWTIGEEGDIIANGNPNFLPIAFSGATFRSKFGKLEAAKQRLQKKQTPKVRVSTVSLGRKHV